MTPNVWHSSLGTIKWLHISTIKNQSYSYMKQLWETCKTMIDDKFWTRVRSPHFKTFIRLYISEAYQKDESIKTSQQYKN